MIQEDFLIKLGYKGFTARVKRISDKIATSCRDYYSKENLSIQQNWHLIFLLLKQEKQLTISDIAKRLQFSHPAIVKIIHKMKESDYLDSTTDPNDQRKQYIRLSQKAIEELPIMETHWETIDSVISQIVDKDFLDKLSLIEAKLDEKCLADRCSEYTHEQALIPFRDHSKDPIQVIFKNISPLDEQAKKLINKLNIYQINLYDLNKCRLESPESLVKNNAYMIGAFVNDQLVGIGGVKLFNNYGEVKRMYVEEEFRGYALAKYILNFIEKYTLKNNVQHLYLETGNKHKQALKFYPKNGFEVVESYGDYQPNDVSVYFKKTLA